jgi:hypothetical protein
MLSIRLQFESVLESFARVTSIDVWCRYGCMICCEDAEKGCLRNSIVGVNEPVVAICLFELVHGRLTTH